MANITTKFLKLQNVQVVKFSKHETKYDYIQNQWDALH